MGPASMQGDAEDLPFETDSFDRYVSAGSIEYWPEPQRGIKEAYRYTPQVIHRYFNLCSIIQIQAMTRKLMHVLVNVRGA